MKLYNTKTNPELTEQVIEYCKMRTSWDYGYDAYWYEKLLCNMAETDIYFVYDERHNHIVSILMPYERFGNTIWTVGTNEEDVIPVLNAEYPNGFFVSGNSYYLNKLGLHATACCASHNEHIIYPSIANAGIWTNNPEHVTVLRDWLEEKYLKPADGWQNRIEYQWIRQFPNMFYDKELQDYPWHRNDCGHYSYIGFHYMSQSHLPENTWYLLAMVDNKPIGCICVEKFEQYGYYGLSYIDVAFPYKNNGVAKKMIHELTKYIPGDLPLLLSMESEEGKKCHIHECFKREKWHQVAFTQDEFDEMCRKKTSFGA
jgi:hypothetical protein